MPLDAKFGLLCGVFVVVLIACFVAYYGRRLACARRAGTTYAPFDLVSHKQGSEGLMWAMGCLVLAIDYSTHHFGLPHGWLFWIHLPFAVGWASCFAVAFWFYTGESRKDLHGQLVYTGLCLGAFAVGLGTAMIITA